MWTGKPDVDVDGDGDLDGVRLDFDGDGAFDDALADLDGDGRRPGRTTTLVRARRCGAFRKWRNRFRW